RLRRQLENLQRQYDRVVDRIRELDRKIAQLKNQPGTGNWTCVYVDKGWEEHAGGHRATHADKATAEAEAEKDCLAHHGSCVSRGCSQPPSPQLKAAVEQRE